MGQPYAAGPNYIHPSAVSFVLRPLTSVLIFLLPLHRNPVRPFSQSLRPLPPNMAMAEVSLTKDERKYLADNVMAKWEWDLRSQEERTALKEDTVSMFLRDRQRDTGDSMARYCLMKVSMSGFIEWIGPCLHRMHLPRKSPPGFLTISPPVRSGCRGQSELIGRPARYGKNPTRRTYSPRGTSDCPNPTIAMSNPLLPTTPFYLRCGMPSPKLKKRSTLLRRPRELKKDRRTIWYALGEWSACPWPKAQNPF